MRVHRAETRNGDDSRRHHHVVPRPARAYKCPRRVVFQQIPKTSTGKIQKFKLREKAKAV
jgi:acyl-coenzyme A synthetase/AMP-(fatty) acid ligase